MTMNPMAIRGVYMRNALFICEPSRRMRSEVRITPSSHAYSTSRSLAMSRKFWCLNITLISPSITARVMTDADRVMHVRLDMNSGVRNLLGRNHLMTTVHSSTEMKP